MDELITIILGAVPFFEFKGAGVFAIFVFKFSPLKAMLLSTIGNLAIVLPLLFVIYKLGNYLKSRFPFFQRLLDFTHRKHKKHFEVWETLALFTFVAIPLPGTGVWSGSLAAYVFNFSFKRAALSIISGTIVSAAIYYILVFILNIVF